MLVNIKLTDTCKMELKTKYQYTYFIHPYKIKEKKYTKYIQKLLKNPKCSLKIFEREKDIGIYNYFTQKIREYMFCTFDYNKSKIRRLKELPIDTEAALLSKEPCIIFEYNIEKDYQGKAGEQKGIFFKIQKLEIICFNTGLCFISLKTNVENSDDFSDVLNFNYKFNKLNDDDTLKDYDKIKIQTDKFENYSTFNKLIEELKGNKLVDKDIIITPNYLTYGYTCIDQKHWSCAMDFEKIKSNYIKYTKLLPNDNSVSYNSYGMKIIDKWNYAKLGIIKEGVTLFTSSIDLNNYTILPQEYENQYLYTYILVTYMRIYLKILNIEFNIGIDVNKTRNRFLKFTKDIWIQEITNDDIGTTYYNNLKEVLEVDNLYSKIKNQYDIFYKELNIEKNFRANIIIFIALLLSLILNVLSYGMLLGK